MYDCFRNAKTKKGKFFAFIWCTVKLLCYIAFWLVAGLFVMICGILFDDSGSEFKPKKEKVKTVTRYIPIKRNDRW